MDSLIRAGGLQGYTSLMKELAIDPQPLLNKQGITKNALNDVDGFISLSAATRLMEESAIIAQCPTLGLQLAAQQDSGVLGVVSVIIQSATTIEQAVLDATRYLFLHSPAMEFSLEPESDLYSNCLTLRLTIHQTEYALQRQAIDAALGYLWKFSQTLIQNPLQLKGVSLPHSPLDCVNAYRRFFGVPVHFEQPYAGLHLPKDALSFSLKPLNPMLRQLALGSLSPDASIHELPVAEQVRRAITRTLGAKKATKQVISDILGMHPRTLQRRLSAEEEKFEDIREEIYKNTTLRFLLETKIPLIQLTHILGFKEQSAFTRSSKRWFGKAPSVIRKESCGFNNIS